MAACTKWGISEPNKALLDECARWSDLSQATVLESQLCHCLKKDKALQAEAFETYLALYACVKKSCVHPLLWEAAQQGLKPKKP
jgi:hypothetical protein